MSAVRRLGSLVIGVLLLAGCSTAVAGRGTSVPRPSSSSPTGPSNAPSNAPSAPPAESKYRTPVQTRLGDPVTAELCTGVHLDRFSRWGTSGLHWYQLAGGCFLDIVNSATSYFQVQVRVVTDAPDLIGTTASASTVLKSGATEYRWPEIAGDCERAIGLPDVAIVITTQQLQGHSPAASVCAAATEMVKEMAVADIRRLPMRLLATPSITRFDLCNLIDLGGVERLPHFSGSYPLPYYGGAECVLTHEGINLVYRYAFVDVSQPLPNLRSVHGHQLGVQSETAPVGCDVVSVQGLVDGGQANEILDLIAISDSTRFTPNQVCALASSAMLDVLNVAGLR
jgi:hypothetical protein